MPGFIDVTGWTTEEVRRLGHADDYDDVDHRPRRKFNSYSSQTTRAASAKYTVSDTWAAACAAHRVNGGYFKECVFDYADGQPPRLVKDKNRHIMMHFLANPDQLLVEDVERGEYCRQFLQNDLTFRTLKNKTNDFDSAIRKVLAVQDQFDSYNHKYELAIVACLPQSVERSETRQNSDQRVQFAQGGLIGKVGDKVDTTVEVINSTYSQQYGIYWIRAITAADQAVFFSNKESFDVGTNLTIRGTVKAHKDNLTQLNRVKVL